MINIKTLANKLVKDGTIQKADQLEYLFCTSNDGKIKEVVGFAHDCFCSDCQKEKQSPYFDETAIYDVRYDLDGNVVDSSNS
jgi:hypothetical protein